MKEKILNFLRSCEGTPVSGEELSKTLGISRTAIWKHIKSLKDEGYEIVSQPKKGHMLLGIPDRLYPSEIRAASNGGFPQEIYYHRSMETTNELAKQLADSGAPEGTLVVAEEQLGGRGRLGRSWVSPAEKGIYCSVILRPRVRPAEATGLTMLAAVAVSQAIMGITKLEVGIKWPNDLLVKDKKICGILTEMRAETDQVHYVVMGIGINVNTDLADFPEDFQDRATSLAIEAGSKISRIELLQLLLGNLEHWYKVFTEQGLAPVMKVWKELNITLGKNLTVTAGNRVFSGLAVDLDETGGLTLQGADSICRTFYSGEVTIKKQADQREA